MHRAGGSLCAIGTIQPRLCAAFSVAKLLLTKHSTASCVKTYALNLSRHVKDSVQKTTSTNLSNSIL